MDETGTTERMSEPERAAQVNDITAATSRETGGSGADLQALLALGHSAGQSGDHVEAISAFEAAATLAPENPWPSVYMGNALRALGKIEEAERRFRIALECADGSPAQVQSLLGLGHCAQSRADHAAALSHFKAATSAEPSNPWAHFYAAVELRHLGRLSDAEVEYSDAVHASETRTQALTGLGYCARQRGDHTAALKYFQEASCTLPSDPWVRIESARTLLQLGKLDDAESAFRQVLSGDGAARLEATIGLGQCARAKGDRASALRHFEVAAAIAPPSNPWPAIYSADELQALGRPEEAADLYRRALQNSTGPARLQTFLGLSHCAQQRENDTETLEYLEAAAEIEPTNLWPHFYTGMVLQRIGRHSAAEAAYRRVLSLDPKHYQATIGLGQLARDTGRRDIAAEMFRKASEIDSLAANAWLEWAIELREQGEFEPAAEMAKTVLARNPEDIQAWRNLADTMHAAGRWDAALEALRKPCEIAPDEPDIWVDMALNERRRGQPAAAVKFLERALKCRPDHSRALENLGEICRLGRDFQQALALFRRAVIAHPTNPWPRIGLSQTLADVGRLAEAMETLDAAEARVHAANLAHPAISAKRVELLRRAGHWSSALQLGRQATKKWPRHFPLWVQRCMMEVLLGNTAAVAACLEEAPAQTAQDLARLHQFRGQAAEAQWCLEKALQHFDLALELAPNDAWLHQNIARVHLLRLDIVQARTHLEQMVQLDADFTATVGRKPRVSWTHYGEILNEFSTDREALASLQASRDLPLSERIASLVDIVREFPDSTASAVTLLVALRQAGRLARPETHRPATSPIPRHIAQYWDTGNPPADVIALMRTWQDWNPDYAVQLFDDAAAADFLRIAFAPDVLLAYRRAKEPAQKADLFRLAWLFAHGGYYVDCDDRCHAPLATIVPPEAGLFLYQEDLGTLGNNIIGSVPHHPLVARALDAAVEAINALAGESVWLATGPGLIARTFAQLLATSRLSWQHWLQNISVLDRNEVYRAVAMHCFVGYKVTERHWSRSGLGLRGMNTASADALVPLCLE